MDVARFKEKLANGRMSRREMLRTLASVGVVPVVMPLAPGASEAASDDHPLMFTWGGYDDANFMQAYVDKYGEPPRFSLFGDEEEAFQKMRSGFEPDLMYPCYSKVRIWHDAGLLAPVEVDRLTNWPDVLEPLKTLPGSDIGGNISVYQGDTRPRVVGNLHSDQIYLRELLPVSEPETVFQTDPRVIPDYNLPVERLREIDGELHFTGKRLRTLTDEFQPNPIESRSDLPVGTDNSLKHPSL